MAVSTSVATRSSLRTRPPSYTTLWGTIAGLPVNDIYNRFFREAFLQLLMSQSDHWVLNGGTNLYCRIPDARHTRDLDLYRQLDPTGHLDAAQNLVATMDGRRFGDFRFTVHTNHTTRPSGPIDSHKVTVEVFLDVAKITSFRIDVSGDLAAPHVSEPLQVTRSDNLDISFLDRQYVVYTYPVENQLADKVCAMYERHGARASTRYHDLYDIALIALHLPVDASAARRALSDQQRIRGMTLPDRLTIPDDEWFQGYTRLRSNYPGHLDERLIDIENALRVATPLVEPLLTDAHPTGAWDPLGQRWTH